MDAWWLMAYELERARRYARPLAVVSFASADARMIESVFRRFDITCTTSDGALVAMLPETDADGVRGLIERARRELGREARIGAAVFPRDGLTLAGLLAHAADLRGPAAKSSPDRDQAPDPA